MRGHLERCGDLESWVRNDSLSLTGTVVLFKYVIGPASLILLTSMPVQRGAPHFKRLVRCTAHVTSAQESDTPVTNFLSKDAIWQQLADICVTKTHTQGNMRSLQSSNEIRSTI